MRARCRADRIAARRRRLHHYPIVRWQARRGNRPASGPGCTFGAGSLGGPDAASSCAAPRRAAGASTGCGAYKSVAAGHDRTTGHQ